MLTGALFHVYMEVLSFLTPTLIFCMLFLTFCKISPRNMKFSGLHVWLILIQLAGSLLLYGLIAPFNEEVAEGILICVVAPTATAAAVITGMLGGNVAFLASFVFLSNVTVALTAPVIFSFLGTNPGFIFLGFFRLYLSAGRSFADIAFIGSLGRSIYSSPASSMVIIGADSGFLYVVASSDDSNRSHRQFFIGSGKSSLLDRRHSGFFSFDCLCFSILVGAAFGTALWKYDCWRTGIRTEKHYFGDLDGSALFMSGCCSRSRSLCIVAEYNQ